MDTKIPEGKWSGKHYIGRYISHAEEKKGKGQP